MTLTNTLDSSRWSCALLYFFRENGKGYVNSILKQEQGRGG